MHDHLLDIRNLTVSFDTDDGLFNAVDNVSFCVDKGEIVGLVGESGCGKSVTSLSILKLIPAPPAKIESGQILFNDRDLLKMNYSK
jgi:ABC-type dipeptide/oligopeptide/nickel transport system ATPase component